MRRTPRLLLVLLVLIVGALPSAYAASTDPVCPSYAVIGTDATGQLLMCPREGKTVHIGGGVSEHITALETRIAALKASIAEMPWNPFAGAVPLASKSPRDWEHFEIDGNHFLALAIHRAPNTHTTASQLYKYDNSTGLFDVTTPWQTVITNGAYDWEYFEIGGDHFLALANFRLDGPTTTLSHVYKYNSTSGKFDFDTPWQSVLTNGARDWKHFEIDGDHYLAVANFFAEGPDKPASHIYKFLHDTGKFDFDTPWQSVATEGAYDWEFFEVGNDRFLAVANHQTNTTFTTESHIYLYDSSTSKFILDTPWQSVITNSAIDWEHFEIDGDHFLALANHTVGSATYSTASYLFKFEVKKGRFDFDTPWQSVATEGAMSWVHFEVAGDHYLAVANRYTGTTYKATSRIYKYSSLSGTFNTLVPFNSVVLNGNTDWVAFAIRDRFFLAAACEDESYVFVSSLP